MARIPDDLLARLKTEVSLQRLVEGRGVELRRVGADLAGRYNARKIRDRFTTELLERHCKALDLNVFD